MIGALLLQASLGPTVVTGNEDHRVSSGSRDDRVPMDHPDP